MDYENLELLRAAANHLRTNLTKSYNSGSSTEQQARTLRDPPPKGPVWVSKFKVLPAKNDSTRDALLRVIDETNDRKVHYDRPASGTLQLEWTGYRKGVGNNTPEPLISEQEKYLNLLDDATSSIVILYIYGGSFCFNYPAAYRRIVGSVAKSTGGKVLMVRQRLAPANPFPAALLDVFQTYLTLLSPPPGSPHSAVPPSQIVLAGDSSGSCLALGLVQVLLHLRKSNTQLSFHDSPVELAMPAGIALLSVAADSTGGLPSWHSNATNDVFPLQMEKAPYLLPGFPRCKQWPTTPPRGNQYCEGPMLAHPIVSPAGASEWAGACPMWMAGGEEQEVDSARVIAKTASAQGVPVKLVEYEGMPHTFFRAFPNAPQSMECIDEFENAVRGFVEGDKVESKAVFVRAKGLKEEEMAMETLVPYDALEARRIMERKADDFKVPKHFLTVQARL